MEAETIRKNLVTDLVLCRSVKDVSKTFDLVEQAFRQRKVSYVRKREVLSLVKRSLPDLIAKSPEPESSKMLREAENRIRQMMGSSL